MTKKKKKVEKVREVETQISHRLIIAQEAEKLGMIFDNPDLYMEETYDTVCFGLFIKRTKKKIKVGIFKPDDEYITLTIISKKGRDVCWLLAKNLLKRIKGKEIKTIDDWEDEL